MEEEAGGAPAMSDVKEAHQPSKRTSGIAGMFPFLQRPSMDTDNDSRSSSDRNRKTASMGGGKVKPGFGSKHRHTPSGDLQAGEPPSPLSADSPSAAWASASYPPADVTDTLSLSQPWPGTSPAPVSTGTPTRSNSGFFKFPFKKRHSKGSASPGVPSSPTLAGATPTHLSGSGSSLSAGNGSQSPSESLCRAGAGAGLHAGSKLAQYSSSGDPDEAEFGSCYSDAMHSPNHSYAEGAYGGDTLDLRQGIYDVPGDASPMMTMRQELPEVFTPGFNQLLGQGCSTSQHAPDTPLDNTAMLEPTIALLSTTQLAQAGQLYDMQSMLLSNTAAAQLGEPCAGSSSTTAAAPAPAASPAVAADEGSMAVRSKGPQTLLEVEDVAAVDAAAAPCPAAPAQEGQQQITQDAVAAEDIQVDVDMTDAPAALPVEAAAVSGSSRSSTPAQDDGAGSMTSAGPEPEDSTVSSSVEAAAAPAPVAAAAAAESPRAVSPADMAVAAPADGLQVAPATAGPDAAPALSPCPMPDSTMQTPVKEAPATPVSPAAAAAAVPAEEQETPAAPAAAVKAAGLTATAAAEEEAAQEAEKIQDLATADTPAACAATPAPAAAGLPAEAHAVLACSPIADFEAAPGRTASPAAVADPAEGLVLPAASSPVVEQELQDDAHPAMAQQVNSRPASPEEEVVAGAEVTEAAAAAAAPEAAEQPATASELGDTAEPCASSSPPPDAHHTAQRSTSPEAGVPAVTDVGSVADSGGAVTAEPAALGSRTASPVADSQLSSTCEDSAQEVAAVAVEAAVAEVVQIQPEPVCLQATDNADIPSATAGEQLTEQQTAVAQGTSSSSGACAINGSGDATDCSTNEGPEDVPGDEQQQEVLKTPEQVSSPARQQQQQVQPEEQQQQQEAPTSTLEQPKAAAVAAEEPLAPADATEVVLQHEVAEPVLQPAGAGQPLLEPEVLEPEVLAEEPALEPEPSEEPILQPEASEEPLLPQAEEGAEQEPSSPTAAAGFTAAPQSCMSPMATAITRHHGTPGSSRRTGRTPVSMVRESIPLFVSDPSRAVGSALVVEDSLDDQDMQQLTGEGGMSAGQVAGMAAAGAAAAGLAGRLLAHGGPQRVTVGFGGSQLNPLTPVAEGFLTSPIPEETSTGGSSHSKASSRYEAAAAGSAGTSPVRQLAFAGHSPRPDGSPQLGMTPGSVYSTPTLTMAQLGGAGGRTQLAGTPASAVSSAVGSAIRDIGSAGRFGPVDRGVSPAMPGLPDVSPTLALMPDMGTGSRLGQGGSGDGSTPSLLDARAASPSAVYSTLYTTTPFRGALAALPIDAALNAPLVDSSPFNLSDDNTFDKAGMAEEAHRVAQNLAAAAAAGGFGATPLPARTTGASLQRGPTSPGGTGMRPHLPDRMMSPTEELRDLHLTMLTKQLADLQKRVKELEGDNLRLREQVEIYEFEKTELNSQEEMEKQARQYAEEQLQTAQMELQAMRQAKNTHQAQMVALKQEFEGLRQEASRQHLQDKEGHLVLEQKVAEAEQKAMQMQEERNQALDRVNLLDMELTAAHSMRNTLQQRIAEVEATVVARERDLQDMTRIQQETQAKMERAMEQMIAAQTAKEHARQKVEGEAAKVQQLLNERQQVMAEREKRERDWQALKAKYVQKSHTLKELEQRLQAKEAENQELMGMCDQLLQQQEAQR